MKVRVGSCYIYSPNLMDRVDGRTDLVDGEAVKVVNIYGCPPANTMGQCYVARADGKSVGMVSTNSLHTKADYIEYLRGKIALIEMEATQ